MCEHLLDDAVIRTGFDGWRVRADHSSEFVSGEE